MLNLSKCITLTPELIESPNICDQFTDADLDEIGSVVYDRYLADKQSREPWERRTQSAIDLAMQVQEEKSFPWPGCSNVAFPLITIAALQFHSRAYPAIVNGKDIVQCRVLGEDPEGINAARAARISTHMSWQLLEQDTGWEEEVDRSLLVVPIVGCAFKKTYYDAHLGHNVSELVLAQNLIINYWARSVEGDEPKTQYIPRSRNYLYERMASGAFKDYREADWFKAPQLPTISQESQRSDNRTGMNPPAQDSDTPFILLEQHRSLDLDGDGYEEPYIITIEEGSQKVVRIVARFDRVEDIERSRTGEILRINSISHYTKYPFIPSPDGGIYDVGFGTLIGPLNESVDTAINQLFDAGTMAVTAGGFLGRGAKIRGGEYQFSPFAWNRVDSTGEDLSKSIFPLPVREPSGVLFNLLNLLIEYTNRISGATDLNTGVTPGQNTPAETSRNAMEQGQKIYSAIFKRIWRALKSEFKKLYQLNAIHLPIRSPFGGAGAFVLREDYVVAGSAVFPVADPTITSDAQRFARAELVRSAALANPMGYDSDAVERLYLKAIGVQDIPSVFPGSEGKEPPVDPKVEIEKMKLSYKNAELEHDKLKFMLTMEETSRLNSAKIVELNAKAMKIASEAQTEEQYAMVATINAQIAQVRADNDQQNKRIELFLKAMEVKNGSEEAKRAESSEKS